MILHGESLYTTNDGGKTYQLKGSAHFINKSKTSYLGAKVIEQFTSRDVPGNVAKISYTQDKGLSFNELGEIHIDGPIICTKLFENTLYIFTEEDYIGSHYIYFVVPIEPNKTISFTTEKMRNKIELQDFYTYNNAKFYCDLYGIFDDADSYWAEYVSSNYKMYSIDGNSHVVICAGQNTLVTNMNINNGKDWNEILDINGNSFKQTFCKIQFTKNNSFYLGGENGYLKKFKLCGLD